MTWCSACDRGGRSDHLEATVVVEHGSGNRDRAALGISGREAGGERGALTLGEGPDLLVLWNAQRHEQTAAASATPAPLAHEQVADRHALRLPGAIDDHLYDTGVLQRNLALQ